MCPRFICSLPVSLTGRTGLLQVITWFLNITVYFYGSSRPSEQSELKLVSGDMERAELSGDSDVRSWCMQENTRELCKADSATSDSSPAAQREAGM